MEHTEILTTFSGTSEQRIQAIFHQLFDDSERAVEILDYSLQNDPSPIVRHEAAYVLGEKENKLCVGPLIRAIHKDNHKIVVHESLLALANLGKIGFPESETVIRSQLIHKDPDVVDTAEISLQRLKMKISNEEFSKDIISIKEMLADLTEDNKEKRIQASFVLMDDASTLAVDLLIESLHREPSSIVKHEIIFSLGEVIHHKVIPELIKILENDKNFFTVHESLLALGTLGDKIAEEKIKGFLQHDDPGIVESAEISLERLYS